MQASLWTIKRTISRPLAHRMSLGLILAALSLVGFATAPVSGDIIFQETWEDQEVGDDLGQLANWTRLGPATDAAGTIQDNNGDLELVISSGNPNVNIWTNSTFDMAGNPTLIASTVFRNLAGNGPGGLQTEGSNGTYRLQYDAGGAGYLRFQKGGTVLETISLAGLRDILGDDFGWGDDNTYEFQVDIDEVAGTNTLTARVNGQQVLSVVDDENPYSFPTVRLALFAWNGNSVAFGDTSLAIIPEPATMALVGLGGWMLLGARRRR